MTAKNAVFDSHEQYGMCELVTFFWVTKVWSVIFTGESVLKYFGGSCRKIWSSRAKLCNGGW